MNRTFLFLLQDLWNCLALQLLSLKYLTQHVYAMTNIIGICWCSILRHDTSKIQLSNRCNWVMYAMLHIIAWFPLLLMKNTDFYGNFESFTYDIVSTEIQKKVSGVFVCEKCVVHIFVSTWVSRLVWMLSQTPHRKI